MPHFRLVPFAPDPLAPALVLTGTVERVGTTLRATYHLAGDLSVLVIPGPAAAPTRRDGLWQGTCLELFCAVPGQAGYLEVNLSPAGHWNVYAFTGYREGMQPMVGAGLHSHRREPGRAELEVGFELAAAPGLPPDSPVDIAITAVIEHTTGAKSYWALNHRGERPDFHRADSRIMRL